MPYTARLQRVIRSLPKPATRQVAIGRFGSLLCLAAVLVIGMLVLSIEIIVSTILAPHSP